jgi:hypothetical protein
MNQSLAPDSGDCLTQQEARLGATSAEVRTDMRLTERSHE